MLNYLLLGNFFVDGLKDITFLLDTLVYKLAQLSFTIFCYLSRITLVGPDIIDAFIRRIYVIIGLVMIFVIAYNLLNYIIDPEKINDKNVGASAFIKDIIIALVIITIMPALFTKAYAFQNTIIEKGVISNIFLGGDLSEAEENNEISTIESGANMTVANVYSAFVTPKYNNSNNRPFTSLDCKSEEMNSNGDIVEYCNAYYKAINDGNIGDYKKFIKNDDKYSYWPLISTVAGIVLAFFMLSYCINLGIRAGKLAVLTIIAPIPALLEIVPGKKGTRQKWVETTIKTYLDVFIYQATVFMIIFLISLIPNVIIELKDNLGSALNTANIAIIGFTLVFLVFGLLQFGKEAPKLISEVLGLKDSGEFAKVAKRALAMGAVTGNAVASTFSNVRSGWEDNVGLTHKIGGALIGGASAFTRNIWEGRNVHDIKGAAASRKKIDEGIIKRRISRQTNAFEYGGNYAEAFGERFGSNMRKTFIGDTERAFQNKLRIEKAHKEVKGRGDSITDIINNDATMQILRDQWLRSEGTEKANIEAQMRARKSKILENTNQFRASIDDLNSSIASHQSVDGISKTGVKFDDFEANAEIYTDEIDETTGKFKASGNLKKAIDGTEIKIETFDVDGNKIKIEETALKGLGQDKNFQERKAEMASKERAAADAEKAAKEKTEEKEKKNN